MKAVKIIAKILVALAAIAGVVYVIATYGNQIVAWCKKVLASLPCCKLDFPYWKQVLPTVLRRRKPDVLRCCI